MNTYRKTATVVGVIYLAGFVVGLVGTGLTQSVLGTPDHLSTVTTNSMILALGAILWMIAVAGDAAHGVFMFPILKQHSERLALGYLVSRILDAVFVAVSAIFIVIQIPLGSEFLKAAGTDTGYLQALSTVSAQVNLYAYDFGMITLGLAGLMLNYIFYKAKLVPRWIAVWGLAGYAVIFMGMISEVMGSGLGLVSSIPGGLWEVFIGVWLIVKGFNSSAFVSQAVGTARTSSPVEPLVPYANPTQA
jgi:hypothetical protein